MKVLSERQNELMFLHNNAPICKTFGMTLSYNNEGQAVIVLPHNPRIDHGFGGIHGGIIATLIDNAGWFTIASYFSHWMATVEFHVRLLEHIEGKNLKAIGEIVRLGKRFSVAEMKVFTDDGQLIALGSGTFALSSVPLNMQDVLPVLKRYEPFFK